MEDSRDRQAVEGVLRLRHIPSLDYVQVRVEEELGQWFVDPASVTVVRQGVAVVGDEEVVDLVRGDPGWRRITDLELATAEGLVSEARVRPGGSWTDMAARADGLVAALVEAGWRMYGHERDISERFGDSVSCMLTGPREIQVELYEDGYVIVWALDSPSEDDEGDDDEPSPPLFSIENATAESCRAAFAEHGWLDPT